MRTAKCTVIAISCYLFLVTGFSNLFSQEYKPDLKKAVVKIRSSSGQKGRVGTGFIFMIAQKRAFILTAKHVVIDDNGFEFGNIVVKFEEDLDEYTATIFDAYDVDIAVLEVPSFPPNSGILQVSLTDIQIGEKIYIYGYPGGGIAQRDQGSVRAKSGTKIFLDDIDPVEGNSGSPLFHQASNQVIGIVLQRSKNVKDQYALTIEYLDLIFKHDPILKKWKTREVKGQGKKWQWGVGGVVGVVGITVLILRGGGGNGSEPPNGFPDPLSPRGGN